MTLQFRWVFVRKSQPNIFQSDGRIVLEHLRQRRLRFFLSPSFAVDRSQTGASSDMVRDEREYFLIGGNCLVILPRHAIRIA